MMGLIPQQMRFACSFDQSIGLAYQKAVIGGWLCGFRTACGCLQHTERFGITLTIHTCFASALVVLAILIVQHGVILLMLSHDGVGAQICFQTHSHGSLKQSDCCTNSEPWHILRKHILPICMQSQDQCPQTAIALI